MNSKIKQLLLGLFVVCAGVGLLAYVRNTSGNVKTRQITSSEMLSKAQAGQVRDVTVEGSTVTGHSTNNEQFRTTLRANDSEMNKILSSNGVNVTFIYQHPFFSASTLISILVLALPCCVFSLLLYLILHSWMARRA